MPETKNLPSLNALTSAVLFSGMSLKSFSAGEIAQSILDGMPICRLETGSSGEDDLLVGDEGECEQDVLNHFEIASLPYGWRIEDITADLIEAAWECEEEQTYSEEVLFCRRLASAPSFPIAP